MRKGCGAAPPTGGTSTNHSSAFALNHVASGDPLVGFVTTLWNAIPLPSGNHAGHPTNPFVESPLV